MDVQLEEWRTGWIFMKISMIMFVIFDFRINQGKFSLGGKEYQLAINNGLNHLHGGIDGFNKKLWRPKIIQKGKSTGIEFYYLSPDGEENYPGNVEVKFKNKFTNILLNFFITGIYKVFINN
jgi:galactose mutarotase-like enzyme